MTDKEQLTATLLDLNLHYAKFKRGKRQIFSPFACAGKLKKFTVPIDLICDTMLELQTHKPDPKRAWGYTYKVLETKKIDRNILQSLQESNGYKQQKDTPQLIKNIFSSMGGGEF